MKIYTDITNFNSDKTIVTIGTFDGVHNGHRQILKHLNYKANMLNAESLLFTFDPHPRTIISNDNKNLKLLTTTQEKIELLKSTKIDNLIVYPFSKEFSKLSSLEFIKNILVKQLNVHFLIVGFNHHFGHDREGNINKLNDTANKHNFKTEKVPPLLVDNNIVSSSKIRHALQNGEIVKANKYLGYNFFISGKVVEGDKLGRSIGFPTANIQIQNQYKLIPQNGVYIVEIKIKDTFYKGMLNIGIRPTINKTKNEKRIEVHIFNFNQNIYNKIISVSLLKNLREEKKFSSINELQKQLIMDKVDVENYFLNL